MILFDDPPVELTYVSLDELEQPPDCAWCGEQTYRNPDGSIAFRCQCWEGGL